MAQTLVLRQKTGPSLLVRAVWFLFVGWWLTGLMSIVGWLAMISIVGLPLGIYIINRIPTYITLRPRTQELRASLEGQQLVVENSRLAQRPWYVRFLWFVVVGWWLSAIVMFAGWVLVVFILTLPLGLMLYNRVPFVASLYRY